LQRRIATDLEEEAQRLGIALAARLEEHLLMITHKIAHGAPLPAQRQCGVDDTRAVRPAIDQVAEEDDLRVRPPLCPVIGIDPGEQGLQQIIAAMNVTDGIDAHAIGHPRAIERAGRRGFLEQATQHGARHIGSGTLKGK
jgi:hypothetical protein